MTQFRTPKPAAVEHQIEVLQTRLESLELSPQTHRRLAQIFERFATYARAGLGAESLEALTAQDVAGFVRAPCSSTGCDPSVATSHLRRTALRILFREARRLGYISADPTIDLVLPSKPPRRSVRPLTDDEVAQCRAAVAADPRLAAAWALAEATASTAELPRVAVGDLDLGTSRVWLAGSTRILPRWAPLTDWGSAPLSRRVQNLSRAGHDHLLIYGGRGSEESRQAASCIAITEVLRRAGLRSPELRPASVRAWAGARVFAETGSIAAVARRLGLRSLDAAARAIGWEWQGG